MKCKQPGCEAKNFKDIVTLRKHQWSAHRGLYANSANKRSASLREAVKGNMELTANNRRAKKVEDSDGPKRLKLNGLIPEVVPTELVVVDVKEINEMSLAEAIDRLEKHRDAMTTALGLLKALEREQRIG